MNLSKISKYTDIASPIALSIPRFGDMRMSKPCCCCLPWCDYVFDDIWYSTNGGMVKYKKEFKNGK